MIDSPLPDSRKQGVEFLLAEQQGIMRQDTGPFFSMKSIET